MKYNTSDLIDIYLKIDTLLVSFYDILSKDKDYPDEMQDMWKYLSDGIKERMNYWEYLKKFEYGLNTMDADEKEVYTEKLESIAAELEDHTEKAGKNGISLEEAFEKTLMIEFRILFSPLQRLYYTHDIIISDNVYNPRENYEKYLRKITSHSIQYYKSRNDRLKLLLIESLANIRNERAILIKKSSTDMLTGVRRREYFFENSRFLLRIAARESIPVSVVMIDVNKFKSINDSYGHISGDIVLKEIASCIRNFIRDTDIAARFGGDEFILFLYNQDESAVKTMMDRLCKNISDLKIKIDPDITIRPSISYGYSLGIPGKNTGLSRLISRADRNMYNNKHSSVV